MKGVKLALSNKISPPSLFCEQNADKIPKSLKIKNALTVYYQQIKAFYKVPKAGGEILKNSLNISN